MNDALQQVINRNDTWRGRQGHFQSHVRSANCGRYHDEQGLATGYGSLDGARFPYDPAAARRLLADAGYEDPADLGELIFLTAGYGDVGPYVTALITLCRSKRITRAVSTGSSRSANSSWIIRRCWSRSLTRHRFNTPSCMAASTRWPLPEWVR